MLPQGHGLVSFPALVLSRLFYMLSTGFPSWHLIVAPQSILLGLGLRVWGFPQMRGPKYSLIYHHPYSRDFPKRSPPLLGTPPPKTSTKYKVEIWISLEPFSLQSFTKLWANCAAWCHPSKLIPQPETRRS